jgi:cell division protein FtsL
MKRTMNNSGDRIRWTEKGSGGKASAKSHLMFFFTLFLLLLIGGSLFYVWSRIQVIQLGYEISNALKEERAHNGVNKKLRLEIATLKSYARIEKLAAEELGMAKPKLGQVIVIR